MYKDNRAEKVFFIKRHWDNKSNDCDDFDCPEWSVWVLSLSLPIFLFCSTKPNCQPRETCYLFHTEIHHLHLITRQHFYLLQWRILLRRAQNVDHVVISPQTGLSFAFPLRCLKQSSQPFKSSAQIWHELISASAIAVAAAARSALTAPDYLCDDSNEMQQKLWQTGIGVDLLVEVRLTLSPPTLSSHIKWPPPRKKTNNLINFFHCCGRNCKVSG